MVSPSIRRDSARPSPVRTVVPKVHVTVHPVPYARLHVFLAIRVDPTSMAADVRCALHEVAPRYLVVGDGVAVVATGAVLPHPGIRLTGMIPDTLNATAARMLTEKILTIVARVRGTTPKNAMQSRRPFS
jgi:hypothetical protein